MWNRLNKSMMFCQMMFGLSFYGVMVILTRFFLEDLNYNGRHHDGGWCFSLQSDRCFAIARWFHRRQILRCLPISNYRFPRIRGGYSSLQVLGAAATNVPMALCGNALASYARGFDVSFLPKSLQTHVQNLKILKTAAYQLLSKQYWCSTRSISVPNASACCWLRWLPSVCCSSRRGTTDDVVCP